MGRCGIKDCLACHNSITDLYRHQCVQCNAGFAVKSDGSCGVAPAAPTTDCENIASPCTEKCERGGDDGARFFIINKHAPTGVCPTKADLSNCQHGDGACLIERVPAPTTSTSTPCRSACQLPAPSAPPPPPLTSATATTISTTRTTTTINEATTTEEPLTTNNYTATKECISNCTSMMYRRGRRRVP